MRRIEEESKAHGAHGSGACSSSPGSAKAASPGRARRWTAMCVVSDAVADARAAAPRSATSALEQSGLDRRAGRREPAAPGRSPTSSVNALRHGGEQAHVRVATSAADGRAVIEVSDDGVGMTSDVAARVFEPFYRPQESRARGEGTAGLGLSIVAAIAEAHGGAGRPARRRPARARASACACRSPLPRRPTTRRRRLAALAIGAPAARDTGRRAPLGAAPTHRRPPRHATAAPRAARR